ncbi:DNA replication licensing factor Mcm6-like [Ctenocephalides felis]|uniref:DNA replication licensing factor Mcm6-like n=1 Tax=Ctenocephalides felis TaxID=7515 RepID=UPI000E6E2A59|nr:DNA replication licensing factor Mcm6-like [Ctenocephalides felis]
MSAADNIIMSAVNKIDFVLMKQKGTIRCSLQKQFQVFLQKFERHGKHKYLEMIQNLYHPDHITLVVSFEDLRKYDVILATIIKHDYVEIYTCLCRAINNLIKELFRPNDENIYYVAFNEFPMKYNLEDVNVSIIGKLTSFTGQVVSTSPIYAEVVAGTFVCLECTREIRVYEEQCVFKKPKYCYGPICKNSEGFKLDHDKSIFINFQMGLVQEIPSIKNIPIMRNVLLRADYTDLLEIGDICTYTGTLISIPDIKPITTLEANLGKENGHYASGENKSYQECSLELKTYFWVCSISN